MTTELPDSEQRTRAIRPDVSFIVQAPAGSGKTGLLIQRYLRLLSIVDAPEEIVAITFTRKAAAEMQGRVLAALAQAATGNPADTAYHQQTLDLARAALEQGLRHNWQLTKNPGRLRIQTIDSLCGSLARQMPVLSGSGGMQQIADDPLPLYEQAAAATLIEFESEPEWSNPIARLVSHLDNDLPRLKGLLAEMLQKRDQWLRYVIHGHNRLELEQSLQKLAQEKLQIATDRFPPDLQAELCTLLHFATDQLARDKPESNLLICSPLDQFPAADADLLLHWQAIAGWLLIQEGNWRARLDKNIGFPAKTKDKEETAQREAMKTRMTALIEQLQQISGLCEALVEIRLLPPVRFSDEEWELVDALVRLLGVTVGQLQLAFNERNQTDFTGIAHAAVNALGTDTEPTDLALYLDYQIKHLLVDEFQDTSISQLELLKRLTAQWSVDDGRTLFLVGDPMQSIYRFREAEVSNFIHTFHQQRLGSVLLQALVLSTNFRSGAGIVEWINDSFSQVFAGADELSSGTVRFHPSVATINNVPGEVSVYPGIDDNGNAEADRITGLIQTLRREATGDTIAILVRNRNHLARILPALREATIPFSAIEIDTLADKPAIQDLFALTRAWASLADRIAWLSVLRAPWCGLDLYSLLILAGKDRHCTVWELCHEPSVLERLPEEARARLLRVIPIFTDAMADRQRRPVRAVIETLWCRLGGPATLSGSIDLQNAETYLNLLEQADRGGQLTDLQSLQRSVSRLYAAVENPLEQNSVRIMTMHKAKGLEFDHVILPGLGQSPRQAQPELMKWMLRTRSDGGHDLLFGTIRETGVDHSPLYQYIREMEKQKDSNEDKRLIYVAATRAKKTLHLFGSASRKTDKADEMVCSVKGRSLLGQLWPVVQAEFIAAMQTQPPVVDTAVAIPTAMQIRRLAANWSLPPLPAAASQVTTQPNTEIGLLAEEVEYAWAGETIKRVGSVMHRCIQWIARDGIENWDRTRINNLHDRYEAMFRQAGLTGKDLYWACNQVALALTGMLDDPRGMWILSNVHAYPHNEYPLTGKLGDTLVNVIIDRTFIDAHGTCWIIDYKTSRHEGPDREAFLDQEQQRYAGQLNRYARLMQQLENRTIKLGLYFPLLQGWREWDY